MSVEYVPLRYVTSVLARGTAPNYVDDGPVRMVSQAANQDSGLDWERTRFHDFAGDPRKLKGYLEFGDSLVNSTGTGTLGRVGWFEKSPDDRPCVADGHVTVTRFDPTRVDKRFGFYYLKSDEFQEFMFETLVNGSTNQIELSRERMSAVSMPVPPLEEQRRIADFLDAETARIDKLSDVTERQVLVLGERLQELFRESTTVGSNVTVRTGIDWMPLISEGWTLNKVAHHFTIGGGTTPSSAGSSYFGDGVYWVNSADIKNGIIESPCKSVTLEAIRDYPSLEIYPRGSLVIALYGQGGTKGRVGILGVEACLNQACCALNESGRVKAEYAFFWFRAHKEGIVSLALGAGQPNLSHDLIKSLWIPAPQVEEQLNIVRRLKSEEKHAARLIASLENRKRLLSERRRALITAAVTGQFDVSAASGRGIEE